MNPGLSPLSLLFIFNKLGQGLGGKLKQIQDIMNWKLGLVALLVLALAVKVGFNANKSISERTFEGRDIHAIWQEGDRICKGQNPYERILADKDGSIHKPPIYFPGFYLLICAHDKIMGVTEFRQFKNSWGKINIALYLLCGLVLLGSSLKTSPFMGLLAMSLWYFNRWSFHSLHSLQSNFIAILPLLLALSLVPKNFKIAQLLFSLSLALKQLAIFALPIWILQGLSQSERRSANSLLKVFLFPILVVAIVSLPFLIWSPAGFFKSITYSAARPELGESLLGPYIGSYRVLAEIALLGLVYWASFKKLISVGLATCLSMFVFISLNSVIFDQYYIWVIAPALAALATWKPQVNS